MNEYRCTRSALYRHDCLGLEDVGARQGHYILAHTPEGAYAQMCQDFPEDEGDFTVTLHIKDYENNPPQSRIIAVLPGGA